MPYWPNDSHFESQLVVASPPGISFIGTGLMMGFGGILY